MCLTCEYQIKYKTDIVHFSGILLLVPRRLTTTNLTMSNYISLDGEYEQSYNVKAVQFGNCTKCTKNVPKCTKCTKKCTNDLL